MRNKHISACARLAGTALQHYAEYTCCTDEMGFLGKVKPGLRGLESIFSSYHQKKKEKKKQSFIVPENPTSATKSKTQ